MTELMDINSLQAAKGTMLQPRNACYLLFYGSGGSETA